MGLGTKVEGSNIINIIKKWHIPLDSTLISLAFSLWLSKGD